MKLEIQLFISGHSAEVTALVHELEGLLKQESPDCTLAVVDVLTTPEKAVEHDVFSTPTLRRGMPEPVIKLIGRLASAHKIMAVVKGWDSQHPDEIIIL